MGAASWPYVELLAETSFWRPEESNAIYRLNLKTLSSQESKVLRIRDSESSESDAACGRNPRWSDSRHPGGLPLASGWLTLTAKPQRPLRISNGSRPVTVVGLCATHCRKPESSVPACLNGARWSLCGDV